MSGWRSGSPGRSILGAAIAADVVFGATALPAALGADLLDGVAIAVAVFLFLISLPLWAWALLVAAARTTRGDDIVVGSLFLLQGPVPRRVRLVLFGAAAASVVLAALVAADNPFGVLVPMLPVGLIGLWGARYGVFPPRTGASPARRSARG